MRVPVLITITFASGTTALLESVMRPVSEALVDWASTRATDNSSIKANAVAIRKATGSQRQFAVNKENTTATIGILPRTTSTATAPRPSHSYDLTEIP